ncbi:MAG: histidinol-phosphate transaminase [Flavobacteriales bacterium]|nr:MAG: histidinol-phosphate transaminase [Flavobacteriales bacterium]
MFNVDNITRKNIFSLIPYSSAREEFKGEASVWLDANENPFETDVNRYPDPYQTELKKALSRIKNVDENQIFIGNGSDEAIDLLFRAFCEPGQDKSYIFPPTYGMYEVSANINNVETVRVNLTADFQLPDSKEIIKAIDSKGLLFICSPNNPTGNIYSLDAIKEIAAIFSGLVVVDEAYIDFSNTTSAISLLNEVPNLVVLQTMSKAYGLAGLRLGMAFASKQIIDVINKIKPPYNVNTLSQVGGLKVLKGITKVINQINKLKIERTTLIQSLSSISSVIKIYPSEANFLLVEFEDSDKIFTTLRLKGIIIRNRTSEIKNCLRITVGTPEQNKVLINAIKEI